MADLKGGHARTAVYSRSLMERLKSDDLQIRAEPADIFAERVESIKLNLVNILNGRAGGSASSPGFGLTDFNDATMGSVDLLTLISADIRACISQFEPRVSDVQVRFSRDDNKGMTLRFVISARTRIGHAQEQMMIDLVMSEGRKFSAY